MSRLLLRGKSTQAWNSSKNLIIWGMSKDMATKYYSKTFLLCIFNLKFILIPFYLVWEPKYSLQFGHVCTLFRQKHPQQHRKQRTPQHEVVFFTLVFTVTIQYGHVITTGSFFISWWITIVVVTWGTCCDWLVGREYFEDVRTCCDWLVGSTHLGVIENWLRSFWGFIFFIIF